MFTPGGLAALSLLGIGFGLATWAAAQTLAGAGAVRALVRTVRVLPRALATAAVIESGFFVGLLFLVVPGLILFTRWFLAFQVGALEDCGWRDALARSNDLVRGNSWSVFAAAFSIIAVFSAVGFVLPWDVDAEAAFYALVGVHDLASVVATAAVGNALYVRLR